MVRDEGAREHRCRAWDVVGGKSIGGGGAVSRRCSGEGQEHWGAMGDAAGRETRGAMGDAAGRETRGARVVRETGQSYGDGCRAQHARFEPVKIPVLSTVAPSSKKRLLHSMSAGGRTLHCVYHLLGVAHSCRPHQVAAPLRSRRHPASSTRRSLTTASRRASPAGCWGRR